jgi:hypothetical protein
MVLAQTEQMVLFQEKHFDARAPERRHALGTALGILLILLSWLPIALLIWALT